MLPTGDKRSWACSHIPIPTGHCHSSCHYYCPYHYFKGEPVQSSKVNMCQVLCAIYGYMHAWMYACIFSSTNHELVHSLTCGIAINGSPTPDADLVWEVAMFGVGVVVWEVAILGVAVEGICKFTHHHNTDCGKHWKPYGRQTTLYTHVKHMEVYQHCIHIKPACGKGRHVNTWMYM